ncbi:MAG: o-succinylbenzoate synthase [Verrucomicrobia bacterium]|nr:o-succinylbenzoate synthase [Verrucomicrobiota bacterium]
MKFLLQYRRYRLPFRAAVRTAHGVWAEREGLMVRLEDEKGAVGFGEAAPIPWFGTETVDEAEAVLRELGSEVSEEQMAAVPEKVGCLKHALAVARAEFQVREANNKTEHLGVAALLPAGRAALGLVAGKAELGFRMFKWKVGVADAGDELAMLDDLCAALPDGAKLRLDANGAWDRRTAERWLARCTERPVEFVEQPCFGTRGADDVLRGLAEDFPTPLALDESLVGEQDIERWLGAGWRGVFVVKHVLLADPPAALARLAAAKATVVFSSALETALGARTALRAAFAWPGERRALGFGVWPLFQDARFDGPATGPFLYAQDVERINPEALWNALS